MISIPFLFPFPFQIPASSECSGMGNLTCSVCECDAGKCGVDCSIDIGDRDSAECPYVYSDQSVTFNSSCNVCHTCTSWMLLLLLLLLLFRRGGLNDEQCSGRERGMCDCNCICNDSPDTSNSTVLGTILSNILVDVSATAAAAAAMA